MMRITRFILRFNYFLVGFIRVRLESQGFVDKVRGRKLYGRSRAYIRVNGRDYSLHRRGFNVVLVSRRTGKRQ